MELASLNLQGTGYISGFAYLGGTATTISVTPSQADFGSAAVGWTSAATTFTLQASAGATGVLDPLIIENPSFRISNDSCSKLALSPGVHCTFDVTFVPSAAGPANSFVFVGGSDGSVLSPVVTGSGR
jgi:hypothetical protein